MTMLTYYFSGIACATFGLAGLFFLKFWKVSRDPFFLVLCATCWLLVIERNLGVVLHLIFPPEVVSSDGVRSAIYLSRLLGFGILLTAIVLKNRSASRR